MKQIKFMAVIMLLGLLASSCQKEERKNPLLEESKLPYGFPDFEHIKTSDYIPAFEVAIKQKEEDIRAIVENKETPTFENTIVALEKSGALLTRVSDIFFNITSAETNEELRQIEKEITPKLTKLKDDINLNQDLFEKIKQVYINTKDSLNTEDARLIEDYYQDFVRGGANLNDEDKEKLRDINKNLSLLSIEFGDHVLNENNSFELVITNKEDLKGLPKDVITQARNTALEKNKEGWVFTLHIPSIIPFLQYSENRALREKIYKGYINKGNNNDKNDNKEVIKKIIDLRVRKAKLLGYKNYADFVLERTVSKNAENVTNLLDKLWLPAVNRAKSERDKMQEIIDERKEGFKLQAWDWWYYAEKVKEKEYALNEEALLPYFELDKVRAGAFMVANKLFGINFKPLKNLKGYHPDVEVFDVTDADGSHIAIYLTDYFPRAGKRSGAWMNSYRKQSNLDGKFITPIIVNVCNFTKPTGDKPALLSLDQVNTLFHEFGHALHGMLSNCKYHSQSGTAVPRDFVEFPSQVMENWATDPKIMKMYAKHYKTGKPIPDSLIKKINKSGKFNQGFATTEYLAAAILDMKWHSLEEPYTGDVNVFENDFLYKEKGLIPEITSRYRSPYFLHIFSGGYATGYYSYIRSEIFDADMFNYFKETDVLDAEKGKAYRKEILSKGATEDPEVLYEKFRGKKPTVEALIEKRGLNEK